MPNPVPETPLAISGLASRRWWRGGVEFGSATRIGSSHLENEDAVGTGSGANHWVTVADGVGGGAGGTIASQMLVQRFPSLAEAMGSGDEAVTQWLAETDASIAGRLAEQWDLPGATTFAGVVSKGASVREWQVIWVGDCRVYLLTTHGELLQISRDQTYLAMGERPPPHATEHDPARMVGCGSISAPGRATVRLRQGEALILCTDGVHRSLTGQQIAMAFRESSDATQTCRTLLDAVSSRGSHDDATVACVRWRTWFGAANPYWWLLLASTTLAVLFTLPGLR